MPQRQTIVWNASWSLLLLTALVVFFSGCSGAQRPSPSSSSAPVEDPIGPNPVLGLPGLEDDEVGGRTLRRVLSRVRRDYTGSLEALTASGALSVVDRDQFYDYPRFEEELTRFLSELGELRLFIREVDVQMSGDHAIMVVDARMVFADRVDPTQRGERRSQVQFNFRQTDRGWRIVEINPRAFFLP